MRFRIVSGDPWTIDGRWVVVGSSCGHAGVLYDPDNGDPFLDIWDCKAWIREENP